MVIKRAQAQVAALDVADATIIRFTGYGSYAFGCVLEATREGFLAFAAAVEDGGLEVQLHTTIPMRQSKLEPVYLYEMAILIPEDWQG